VQILCWALSGVYTVCTVVSLTGVRVERILFSWVHYKELVSISRHCYIYIHLRFRIFISAVCTEYETCHNFTNNTSFHVTITTNITNSNNIRLNKYIKYKVYLHLKSIDAYWDNCQSTYTPLTVSRTLCIQICVVYLTTLLMTRLSLNDWVIVNNELGRTLKNAEICIHGIIWGIIPAFSWMDWGKPQETSDRIISVLAKIQTEHLLNTGHALTLEPTCSVVRRLDNIRCPT
jgi:hypothetical protein